MGNRDEYLIKLLKEHMEQRGRILNGAPSDSGQFLALPFDFIQKNPKLLLKMKNALPLYLWLASHICRDPNTTWAGLGKIYQLGLLATVRHKQHIMEEMGIGHNAFADATNLLTENRFMYTLPNYSWPQGKAEFGHGTLYILGVHKDSCSVQEWFCRYASLQSLEVK